MKFQLRIKGIILVLISAMLWGISGTVAQYLFQKKGFSPEWLVVIRLLVSGLILLLYAFIKEKQDLLSSIEPLSAAFLSVLWLNVPLGLPQWLGIACIISTVVILSCSKNKSSSS